ncbi:peptidase [Lactobacillus phage 521B]|uniref:Peptidase n=2 Tax=Tybeckvirus TaxID=2843105 RepID=A0A4Y5FHH9_9CAUD|nr:peptidase [Lactobacillus phage 521B]YP_009844260.1 peptidase [Lactobacillus phage SAC12B]QBJ03454.1 peptidase [Lactobacillus phage 521B]QBJ03894.1 peptidase [Lactobacillus phage SAC12B]
MNKVSKLIYIVNKSPNKNNILKVTNREKISSDFDRTNKDFDRTNTDFKRSFRNLTNDDKAINKSVNQMLNSKGMKELLKLFEDGDSNL